MGGVASGEVPHSCASTKQASSGVLAAVWAALLPLRACLSLCSIAGNRAIALRMKRHTDLARPAFTPLERDYIRQELDISFGTFPSVSQGFYLRTWKSGPHAGQARLPKAVETLVARGLMEVRPDRLGPRAFFTLDGMRELRKLVADRRYIDPVQFRHLLVELGVGEQSGAEVGEG